MDFEILWIGPALRDLEQQTADKVEHVGSEAALQHLDRIYKSVELLGKLPGVGKACRELPGYFERVVRPDFRIIYQVSYQHRKVKICAVIPAKRDFLAAWCKRSA